ncbi:qde-2-interacting protein [Apiospora marii]|uniref:Qde-2-interacting protein n=1 Tax=Apiospora marii TaxID=335849 RepID=A0ABR1SNP9_9PEZI
MDSPEPPVVHAGGASITWPTSSDAAQFSGQLAYMNSDDEDDRIFICKPQQQQKPKKKRPKRRRQEPASAQAATALVQAFSATSTLKTDDIAPEGLLLCPFKLVRQFPYKHVGSINRQKVQDFFMECVFESEEWNIRAPLLLVPTAEFEEFLQYVNRELRVLLTVPTGKDSENFSLRFPGCTRPQFAGKVGSKDAYDALKSKLAQSSPNYSNLHPAALGSFKDEIDKIYESVKKPKKKDPAVQRAKIMAKQKRFGQTTKRVQRYLGLRTRTAYSVGQDKDWNTSMPPPFRTEFDVRFVCIDAEAHEADNKTVTEVGIAILDTQDTVDLAPGESGRNWFDEIQAHHLRVAEVAHVVNTRFVQGCPGDFNFGKSEIIPRKHIVSRIESIIGTGRNNESSVVMVGHELFADLKYLRDLGFNLWNSPLFLDEADTKEMFQRVRRDTSGRKLTVICNELGIPGRNFHNAGNDAVYTLRAMITMAVLRKTGYPEVVSTTDNPREIPRYGSTQCERRVSQY